MPPRKNAEFVLNDVTDGGPELWDLLVDMMDWNRVLFEAHGRHLELDHGLEEDPLDLEYNICGECVAEALKVQNTYPNWKKEK